MPRVKAKWEQPENEDIFIGRPGPWGNPFVMKSKDDIERARVIAAHKEWFLRQPSLINKAKRELVGHNLVCYCAPKPCHGDLLLSIANEP